MKKKNIINNRILVTFSIINIFSRLSFLNEKKNMQKKILTTKKKKKNTEKLLLKLNIQSICFVFHARFMFSHSLSIRFESCYF